MTFVVFKDAELVVVTYLRAALASRAESYVTGVKVGTHKPNPMTVPFIAVRRAGGTSDAVVIDRPRVDVQVWHADDGKAQDLAQMARALLLRMPLSTAGVNRVTDFLGPTPIADP